MNTEKIGELIKKIRQENNLTQKELADKLHVTYQAVSKWENGKSIPDIETLKEISEIFNTSIDEIITGKKVNNKRENKKLIIGLVIITIIILAGVIIYNSISKKDSEFEFKNISTTCNNFTLTGSVAYSKDKTSLYISKVEFCGNKNETIYKKIECKLYESFNNTNTLISDCDYKENISLEKFLQDVRINVNNYQTMCSTIASSEVYIEISAYNDNNEITTYKIPVTLKDNC